MSKYTRTIDKAIKILDSSAEYNRYLHSIVSEKYDMASKLFRQAEQDDDLTDNEIDKLLNAFVSKFNKRPR